MDQVNHQAKHSLIMTLRDCDKDNQNGVEKIPFINGIISEWGEQNLRRILQLGETANLNDVIGGYNKSGLKDIFKGIFNSNAHNMESIVLERHKQKIQKLPHKYYFNESGVGGRNISIYPDEDVVEYITAAMKSDAGPGSGSIPYPPPGGESVTISKEDLQNKYGLPQVKEWKTTTTPETTADLNNKHYGFTWDVTIETEWDVTIETEKYQWQTTNENETATASKIITQGYTDNKDPDNINVGEGGRNGLITTVNEKTQWLRRLDPTLGPKAGYVDKFITRKELGDTGQIITYCDYCDNNGDDAERERKQLGAVKDTMFLTCDQTVFYRTVEQGKSCCLTGIRNTDRDKEGLLFIPSTDPKDKIRTYMIMTKVAVLNSINELKKYLDGFAKRETSNAWLSTMKRNNPYLKSLQRVSRNTIITDITGDNDFIEVNYNPLEIIGGRSGILRKIVEKFIEALIKSYKNFIEQVDIPDNDIPDIMKQADIRFQELKLAYMFPMIVTRHKTSDIVLKDININGLSIHDDVKRGIEQIYTCFGNTPNFNGDGKKYQTGGSGKKRRTEANTSLSRKEPRRDTFDVDTFKEKELTDGEFELISTCGEYLEGLNVEDRSTTNSVVADLYKDLLYNHYCFLIYNLEIFSTIFNINKYDIRTNPFIRYETHCKNRINQAKKLADDCCFLVFNNTIAQSGETANEFEYSSVNFPTLDVHDILFNDILQQKEMDMGIKMPKPDPKQQLIQLETAWKERQAFIFKQLFAQSNRTQKPRQQNPWQQNTLVSGGSRSSKKRFKNKTLKKKNKLNKIKKTFKKKNKSNKKKTKKTTKNINQMRK
jgi:hypothetical protein